VDIHVRETDAPGDDPYADLTPEVLPGPEVLPEDGAEVPRPPLSLHRLLDRAKPSLAEATSLAALVLEALAVMHDTAGAHGRLDRRSIRLTPSCTVRIDGRRTPKAVGGAARADRRADIRAAAAIVAEIDKATGRPNRRSACPPGWRRAPMPTASPVAASAKRPGASSWPWGGPSSVTPPGRA
jgi:hypothetical protein